MVNKDSAPLNFRAFDEFLEVFYLTFLLGEFFLEPFVFFLFLLVRNFLAFRSCSYTPLILSDQVFGLRPEEFRDYARTSQASKPS